MDHTPPRWRCDRHNVIGETADDFGWPLCSRCFTEAIEAAESKVLDDRIRTIRNSPQLTQSSAAWLISRLGWSE